MKPAPDTGSGRVGTPYDSAGHLRSGWGTAHRAPTVDRGAPCPNRRAIRLEGYDYAQAGAYFVTICTQHRACLFGEVSDAGTQLYDAGRMVIRWWVELRRKFQDVETDEFVVMPNHIHGIVVLVGADLRVRPDLGAHTGAPLQSPQHSGGHTGPPLPRVIQWFKTMTTNEYIRRVKTDGWMPFTGRLWQRNYYEHVIRNNESLARIRQYIADNPARWAFDRENPLATTLESKDAWRQ